MARKLLTVDEFRAAARETGAAPDGTVTRLVAEDPQVVDDTNRTIRFVFSDSTVDRSGDSIVQNGWRLDQFTKNPVALWAHDSFSPPIGRAANVGVSSSKLIGDIEFMTADVSPFADSIYKMVKGRYLRAVSVGFIPLKYVFVSDAERPWGIDFLEQELLEISVCPIPCNPNALGEARSKGIDTGPLLEWVEQVLDGAGQVAVPRRLLEETFRTAKTPRTIRQKYLARAESSDWKVGASRDLPIDNSDTWDGPAAAERMLDAAGFNGDTPDPAAASRGFLIHDAANTTLKGSYKLPFADIVGGELKAVAEGIRAAASRLPQTDAAQTALDDARKVIDDYEGRMSKAIVRRASFVALRKDLDNCAWLASLLGSLASLEDWIEWETEYEGDNSPIADRLSAVISALGQILIDMTAEEVAELLGDETGDPAADPMMMAGRTPGQKALIILAGQHAKGGRSVSAANTTLLNKAMDHHAAASQCVKDVLASNEGDMPMDPGDDMVVDPPSEDDRAKRIREAQALKAGLPKI